MNKTQNLIWENMGFQLFLKNIELWLKKQIQMVNLRFRSDNPRKKELEHLDHFTKLITVLKVCMRKTHICIQ